MRASITGHILCNLHTKSDALISCVLNFLTKRCRCMEGNPVVILFNNAENGRVVEQA